jgi:hypothetical protein
MEKHVMMKSVCAASILAIAAGASAAPFTALSYEAGGGLPGIAGPGISVSSGGFFTADGAGDNVVGGGASNFNAGNEQEFDSHFALDGFGPTARNRTAVPANNSTATTSFYGNYGPTGTAAADYNELEGPTFNAPGAVYISGPGSHVGDAAGDASNPENSARAGMAVSPPPVGSSFAPLAGGGRSAFDGIFVGRFTVSRGATLSGGMLFNTVDPNSPTGFSGAILMLGGPGVSIGTINGQQVLGLRSYLVTQRDLQNPSAATADGINNGTPFGLADVYDLWVQVIPTPGTLAIAGLAGIAVIRRRRA